MIRTGVAVLVAALVLGWVGNGHDGSFRDQMVPVKLAKNADRILLVARHEVTAASWQQCHDEGGCSYMPVVSTTTGSFPVVGVNWFDVEEYLSWANAHAGGGLRLPTLAEWRVIDRSFLHKKRPPLFMDPRLAWAANYGLETSPSGPPRVGGSFSTTPDGISDLDGNVWEWTSSCVAPRFDDTKGSRCPAYVAAGEHEANVPVFVRIPASGGCAIGTPPTHLGFRLVADY